jgi:GNAT superfamily N-acetyltransferase
VDHFAPATEPATPLAPAWLKRYGAQSIPITAPALNSLIIRRAGPGDAEALTEIAARTFIETFGAENTPEDLDAHILAYYSPTRQAAEIADPNITILLALQVEKLVGFAYIQRSTAPICVVSERPVELRRFYFAKSSHGSGFASVLMQAARQAALELNGTDIWLGVWERNPRAIAFYSKSGFVRIGSHIFTVGNDRQTDYIFISPLSRQSSGVA